jgi:DNA-binding LytR/AlgR family response regulator
MPPPEPTGQGLRVLVADDEAPARGELGFLLREDDRIASVVEVASGVEALMILEQHEIDAVFLDIAMPGFSGLELARVLSKFENPPAIVFVTAHHEHAVEAFEINVVDYLLKPVRSDRARESVRRILATEESTPPPQDEAIAVELGGVTRFIPRSTIRYVEAQGDYVRLHTDEGGHLLRVPLGTLEDQWSDTGFVRIHRRFLVATHHITEVRQDGNRCTVVVGGVELDVSRRHTRDLKDLLIRSTTPIGARPGTSS